VLPAPVPTTTTTQIKMSPCRADINDTSVNWILPSPLSQKSPCYTGQLFNGSCPRNDYCPSHPFEEKLRLTHRSIRHFPLQMKSVKNYVLNVLRTIKMQNQILELEM